MTASAIVVTGVTGRYSLMVDMSCNSNCGQRLFYPPGQIAPALYFFKTNLASHIVIAIAELKIF
jgi:hypothetical protein